RGVVVVERHLAAAGRHLVRDVLARRDRIHPVVLVPAVVDGGLVGPLPTRNGPGALPDLVVPVESELGELAHGLPVPVVRVSGTAHLRVVRAGHTHEVRLLDRVVASTPAARGRRTHDAPRAGGTD